MTETTSGLEDGAAADQAPVAVAAVPMSVGGRLRQAREAAGLSVGDVAGSLKFSPRQIEALEGGDFAALHGATLIRGFVRSYARLLKLDTDGMLAQLEQSVPRTAIEIKPMPGTGAEMPHDQPRQQRVRWMLMALLLAGVAAALSYFAELPVVSDDASSGPPQAAPAAVQPVASPEAAPPSLAPAPVAAPGQAAEVPAPVADPAARQLQFAFSGASWVEVRDGTGRMLMSQNNLAGTRQAVIGHPPFQVVVGNAPQVKLQYGDAEVDLTPHTRAEVARFSLE